MRYLATGGVRDIQDIATSLWELTSSLDDSWPVSLTQLLSSHLVLACASTLSSSCLHRFLLRTCVLKKWCHSCSIDKYLYTVILRAVGGQRWWQCTSVGRINCLCLLLLSSLCASIWTLGPVRTEIQTETIKKYSLHRGVVCLRGCHGYST